jgi:photosystem II stability/assembly factor-like uncharacterized protein
MEKRELTIAFLAVLIMAVFVFCLVYITEHSITGFAVFQQNSQSDFDEGDYSSTEYNGSAVVLSEGESSGTYTSKVFDAGDTATWNNITHLSSTPTLNQLFCVDGGGDIYQSTDYGETWGLSQEDYGRTTATTDMFSNQNFLYILSSNGNEVWNSSTGDGFAVVNDSFSNSPLVGECDSNDNLYVLVGNGEVYKSVDNGTSWVLMGDINSGTQNPKGITAGSNNDLYAVDSTGAVYHSSDDGQTWIEKTSDYGGGSATDDLESDSSDELYILFNKEVHKSTDSGATWTQINDSFTPYSQKGMKMLIDNSDNFFIVDAIGRIFESDDNGITWTEIGDCNGEENNDVKGLTSFSQSTNLNFQVRSCDDSECSGESWEDIDDNSPQDLSLDNNQYFQYKFDFSTPDSSVTPSLQDVEIDYDLINQAPSISITYPTLGLLLTEKSSIALNFSVSDADGNLDSCWYNLDSGENTTISGCENTTFSVASDGTYTLSIYANDSAGLESSDDVSFNVDSTGVSISISQPTGTKSSRTNIPLDYTTSGSNLTCWYNVKTSVGSEIIGNTTLSNCSDSQFNVSNDGDYVLNLHANNSFGNTGYDFSSFSVDTSGGSSSPSSSRGSSDAGGGSFYFPTSSSLEIQEIGDVIVYPGEEKSLKITVKNKAGRTMNKCKIVPSSEYENWIEADIVESLAPGEIINFICILTIPNDVEVSGDVNPEINLECLEESTEILLMINLINPELSIELSKVELKAKDEFYIEYLLESDSDSLATISFSIFDSNGQRIAEKIQEVDAKKQELIKGNVVLELGDVKGELLDLIVFKPGQENPLLKETIIYDARAITGFAVQNLFTSNITYIFLICTGFAVFAFFKIRRILRMKKRL